MSVFQRIDRRGGVAASSLRLLPLLLAGCALAAPAKAETALDSVDFALAQPHASITTEAADGEAKPLLLTSLEIAPEAAAADDSRPYATGGSDADVRLSFGAHVKSIKNEMLVAFGYMTLVNGIKIARSDPHGFRFIDEGWFGKDTRDIGVDKLVHAHNSYMLAELIGARIRRNTGTTRGTALSGAILASGLMLYSELFDGPRAGFGVNDLLANAAGAGFSVVRNTVPGLEEKLDFRVLILPNYQIYSPTGREHYRQLRYLLALELGGFDALRRTPLRFVELHAGYYATGFTRRERQRGETPERKLFAGVGVNLNELLFGRSPRTKTERAASQVLDYWQPPYTYIHAD